MRIAARLLFAAGLIVSFAVLDSPEPTRAEVDGSVAIGCEFLFFIDAPVNGCDGVTAAEVQDLADLLGDEDDVLEPSDFDGIDFDANQIYDGGGGQFPSDAILVFAFVDNDGVVTFDAEFGVTVAVNTDGLAGGADDLNPETCESDDDLDCDTATLDDGDGVVIATITDSESIAGDDIGVDIWQADDPSTLHSEAIFVVGPPDEVTILTYEPVVQKTTFVDDCLDEANVLDESQVADADKTFVAATVTDSFGTQLARAQVTFSTSDRDIADIGSDTFFSIDRGVNGIAALAVVCGGEQLGLATITAEILGGEESASVDISVVGPAAAIAIVATPASILCDGNETSTVTATVRDSQGSLVADGVAVNFSVVIVGIVTPINTTTINGQASTSFYGVSSFTQGVPVVVTAGFDAQASILIICQGFDTDGDGMPNTYEDAHPCLSTYAQDALADPDGDALNNRAEFLAGTNACVFDTDSDGCGDGAETLALPSAGGDRSPLDPWDFYDVTGDGAIDLADTVAILQKFGLSPTAPGYVAAYDRYAPNAQKPYRTAQATGSHLGIDIADAVVNLQSFGHSCI